MKKFEFTITLSAPTQNDAVAKMKALQELGKHLNSSDLKSLADVVGNPVKLAYAKQQLGID